ncbi:hypothetical protein K1T71_007510 [Dendrolimus kikuchii]|uniref:Uncharacterized protein n=1 Tax=Dendrolimus kikuchii TaxID=765133 RepID=A0ACC1D0X9_9NEOP|nr:hypothetical protein K1T71_007510 [Dendrolimus kikuchii]
MMLLLIWTTVIIAALILYFRRVYTHFSRRGVKTLTPLPLIGNLAKVTLRIDHFTTDLEKLYDSFPNDRFVGRYDFVIPVVMLRDVELIKQVAIKDFEYFLNHRSLIDDKIDPLVGRNLFVLKGQEWKDMRSTLSPAFTSSKIKHMVPFMVEVGGQMIEALKTQFQKSNVDYIDVDCKDLTTRYANDVIASCAFGLKVDSQAEQNNEFYEMGKTISNFRIKQMFIFLGFLLFPKMMKKLKITFFTEKMTNFFRNLVQGTMQERELKSITRHDMIHLLMEAKKGKLSHDASTNDSDAGFATVEESSVGKKTANREWSDDDLLAQALLFFAAGFETVSSAMSFTLHELALNPDIQQRLYQEIKENEMKSSGKFDYNSIQNLKYLDMVVSEALRLWPPAFILERDCLKDYNLGKPNTDSTEDFINAKGTGVFIPVWCIHRDPKYFPDPLKFNPERFSDENKQNIKPFTYIPFGVGPRNCIGSRFALCEVKVMIYQLLQYVEVSPGDKTNVKSTLAKNNVNLKIEGGHWIRMREEWKDMRSTLSPAFTSSKMKLMVPFMVEVGDQMIRALKKKVENSGMGYIDVDCKDLTTRYANDVIASCAFGLRVDSHTEENNQFYKMGKTASTFNFKQMLVFFGFSSFPKIMEILKVNLFTEQSKSFFRDLVISTMQDRENRHIVRPDMIHLLMEAKKGQLAHDEKTADVDAGFATVEESAVGKKDVNRVWSNDDLIAQAVVFFIAGFEAVSVAMSFTLHELALHPEIQERLYQEIKENERKHGGKFDYNSIQSMKYMDMVVSEVLRLWPAAIALDRNCLKDYNLGKPNSKAKEDFILRKGIGLFIPVWCFHRDANYFPDPLKFDPERFSDENKHKINPFTYMPFGVGPRNCIGSRFALCEVKVMVYQLLQHMEVSPCEKTSIKATLSKETFNLRIHGGHCDTSLVILITDTMLLTIWLVTAITALVLYLRQIYSKLGNNGVRHLPPIPLFGNWFWVMMKREHVLDAMTRSMKAFPNDRIIGQYELIEPAYIINDLELVKKVALKDFDHFVDRQSFLDDIDPLFGRNLLVLKGEEWKAMRSTLSPAFTSSKIRLMVPLMVEVGEQMIKFLRQKINDSGTSFIDIEGKDLATRYANDVIASCAFGLKTDTFADDNNAFYKVASSLTTLTFKKLMSFMIYRISPTVTRILGLQFSSKDEVKFYNEIVLGTMKYRDDNKIIRNDMIDILLQAKKGQLSHDVKDGKDVDAGFATVEESAIGKKHYDREWSDTDLVAQAVLFLFAGFDTVSTTMAFMLHELAVNPDVQERLYREIIDNEECNGGKFDYNSVQHMKYLDMVVSESMRLWPAAAFTNRKCVKPYNMGKAYDGASRDCIIPVGANIVLPIWFTHHNPDYFPEPSRFDPERFSDENKHSINPFSYQPFGMGPRNCIGSRFALCEMKVMTYQLLQHFEVSPAEKTSNPVQLAKKGFVMRIQGGAWVRLKLR